MAGFRKAKAEQAALKYGLYGPPGKGKTLTSLLIAEGLAALSGKRVAYVDTERGTDFYVKDVPQRIVHPKGFDFDALYTRSLTETLTAVKAIDPEVHGVCVVDSVTHIWESARQAYNGKETSVGGIPLWAWGKIKKPYKELINFLLSSPMHVIFCGRQGNEFEEDENGDMKKVGVKMKAEGETAYEPHILIRMEVERGEDGSEGILAIAEKDRTGILAGRAIRLWPTPKGKEVGWTFDQLVKPILPLLGGVQAKLETEDETAAKDAEAIAAQDASRAENSSNWLSDLSARIQLCKTPAELKELGKGITKELKAQMLPQHVTELRECYQRKEKGLANGSERTVEPVEA